MSKTKTIEEMAINAKEGEISEMWVALENSYFYYSLQFDTFRYFYLPTSVFEVCLFFSKQLKSKNE